MARRRGLSEAEKELWSRVARSAVPLHPKTRPDPAPDRLPPPKSAPPRIGNGCLQPVQYPDPVATMFRVGQGASRPAIALLPAPSPAERLAGAPVRMDHKTHKRMKQGKLCPEARLDLHGRTLAAAQPELLRFIMSCQAAGLRLVLVITGKGRGSDGPLPTRPGALRHQVPHWLHMAPLSGVVQQVTAAHFRHGGEGAYYVYLRK